MAAQTETPPIDGSITMGEVLSRFPGAKRSLFARYHIGGCQSCSYDDAETLAQVCERNENLPVEEVIDHILAEAQVKDIEVKKAALEKAVEALEEE